MTPRQDDPRARRGTGTGTAQRPGPPVRRTADAGGAARTPGTDRTAERGTGRKPAAQREGRTDGRGRRVETDGRGRRAATDGRGRRAETDSRSNRAATESRGRRAETDSRSNRAATDGRGRRAETDSRSNRAATDGRGRRAETESRSNRAATEGRGRRAETESRGRRAETESRGRRATTEGRGRNTGRPDRELRPSSTGRKASRPMPSRGRTAGEATPRARVVSTPAKPRRPKSVRGRRVRTTSAARVNHKARGRTALVVMLAMLCVAFTKLVWIQTVDADAYAAAGDNQRERTINLPAQRGAITDRNGQQLAFSIEGRRMAVRPSLFVDDAQRAAVIDAILAGVKGTGAEGITRKDLAAKLTSDKTYVYVADGLLPEQANKILVDIRPQLLFGAADSDDDRLDLTFDQKDKALNAVVTERQDIREYPNAGTAEAVIGSTGWDGHGLSGIETRFDSTLAGVAGSRNVEIDSAGNAIPGTVSGETTATDGSGIQLTLDTDAQYTAQQMLADSVARTGSQGGNLLALDAKTGKVVAMASSVPGKDPAEVGNQTITDPVEPGSVNKVVTFAAALERGLIDEDTVLTVDGRITMGGVTVGDAWSHGPVDMTATGILAKSSNVGTLMLAQQVGEKDFYSMLTKFGIGSKTGIQLNGESAGLLPKWNADPAKSQWSASTFANLPIGQGVAMTMIQLASAYQAIANDGVRIEPSLIEATTTGTDSTPAPARSSSRVMSAETAKTLRSMLTATTQDGNMVYSGTAPAAAVTGYQVAGKTGTAQQVDPETGAYSDSLYTTTFAGMIPADDPQYVIVISLDRPGGDREGGTSAAPLFHDYAGYLMDAMNVPPSATEAPRRELYVNLGG